MARGRILSVISYVITPYDYKPKFIIFIKRNIGRINWRLIKINIYGGEEQINEEDGGKSETFWINLVYVFGHKIFFLKLLKKKIETQQKQGNLTEY